MFYCDKCGKPATHVSLIEVNGHRTETHLCAECAGESEEFNDFIEPMIGEFFDFPIAFARRKPSKRIVTCPTCGYTNKEYLATGRLNCPDCYKYLCGMVEPRMTNFFADQPAPIEKVRLKKNTLPKASEVDSLKEQLKCAIAEERYEDCAALKRQIDNIEGNK